MFRKTIGLTICFASVRYKKTSKKAIKDEIMRLLRGEGMKM